MEFESQGRVVRINLNMIKYCHDMCYSTAAQASCDPCCRNELVPLSVSAVLEMPCRSCRDPTPLACDNTMSLFKLEHISLSLHHWGNTKVTAFNFALPPSVHVAQELNVLSKSSLEI